ncbi:MAG: glycosyltransferase [Hyphomicrobiaceae bacterium]
MHQKPGFAGRTGAHGAGARSDVSNSFPISDTARRLNHAVLGLRHAHPEFSAATPVPIWQWMVAFGAVAVMAMSYFLVDESVPIVIQTALLVGFFLVVVLRFATLVYLLLSRPDTPPLQRNTTATAPIVAASYTTWPVYTVLLPVYDEAAVLGQLLAAVEALDYPKEKLDVLLIVEAGDERTQSALARLVAQRRVPSYVRVIVVPPGGPQTKPRALNYAMTYARGAYAVIYDAEDLPEPDQLRRALHHFRHGPKNLGCLQARLQICNVNESWFSRQFTIEYTALFDAILPTLQRLRLPIPLGGTSNHFRRDALDGIGRWDPYNVTEDADLGLRLSRAGWQVEVLSSTTWEEAPPNFKVWLGQRTRWLKGWWQTYLVQMRSPMRLFRELGWWKFWGVQMLMGGLLLSPIIHPWFYLYLLSVIGHEFVVANSQAVAQLAKVSGHPNPLWPIASNNVLLVLGALNLLLGYFSAMLVGAISVRRRRRKGLVASVLWMPIYWLFVSLASYRALLEFCHKPFHWEKTPHRSRRFSVHAKPGALHIGVAR